MVGTDPKRLIVIQLVLKDDIKSKKVKIDIQDWIQLKKHATLRPQHPPLTARTERANDFKFLLDVHKYCLFPVTCWNLKIPTGSGK